MYSFVLVPFICQSVFEENYILIIRLARLLISYVNRKATFKVVVTFLTLIAVRQTSSRFFIFLVFFSVHNKRNYGTYASKEISLSATGKYKRANCFLYIIVSAFLDYKPSSYAQEFSKFFSFSCLYFKLTFLNFVRLVFYYRISNSFTKLV